MDSNEKKIFSSLEIKRPQNIYYFNSDCEVEIEFPSYETTASRSVMENMGDFELVPLFLSKRGDIIVCRSKPDVSFLRHLSKVGFDIPEFMEIHNIEFLAKKHEYFENYNFVPWGWTPNLILLNEKRLNGRDRAETPRLQAQNHLRNLYSKTEILGIRNRFRNSCVPDENLLGPQMADGIVTSNFRVLSEQISLFREKMEKPTVIKNRFGAAGRGLMLISDSAKLTNIQADWIKSSLERNGEVLAEPWLPKVIDLSAQILVKQGEKTELLGITRFLTDRLGRYVGHVLGKPFSPIIQDESASIRILSDIKMPIVNSIRKASALVSEMLIKRGYSGYAGIDFIIYSGKSAASPKNSFFLSISEINPRMTMGTLALSLQKKIDGSETALWLTIDRERLGKLGFRRFSSMPEDLLLRFPVVKNRDNLIKSGIFFTNPPEKAKHTLGVVAVGEKASSFLLRSIS
ncbi:MAG: hypothetical protein HQK54_07045 [Oligoflexales bacterium]|nr:hypothetical protein [Oligoflexales bacterium]